MQIIHTRLLHIERNGRGANYRYFIIREARPLNQRQIKLSIFGYLNHEHTHTHTHTHTLIIRHTINLYIVFALINVWLLKLFISIL